MSTYRPTITGERHMISAGHYSAAHAGFQILEAGGNAIDAGLQRVLRWAFCKPTG